MPSTRQSANCKLSSLPPVVHTLGATRGNQRIERGGGAASGGETRAAPGRGSGDHQAAVHETMGGGGGGVCTLVTGRGVPSASARAPPADATPRRAVSPAQLGAVSEGCVR